MCVGLCSSRAGSYPSLAVLVACQRETYLRGGSHILFDVLSKGKSDEVIVVANVWLTSLNG